MSDQYQVSARKYRPLRFEDVVGQDHIAGTLKNALSQGKVAHAFLFTGPRGVGKTTCARILASTLNCQNPTNHEPCGTCASCTAFRQGQSFNIVELDAASNNSVEHIRSLTEQVRFAPQSGKYKVFIIDEVHMLSSQAFNAFLKTLEEPPSYAIFILATTEKHKILPTILSRCQIFDFKRITVQEAVDHLQAVCVKEGIDAEPEALHVIGQKADGAMRDALSIFDRVAASANGKLTYAHVIEQLNVLDSDFLFRFTEHLLAEDHAEVINLFDVILSKGFDTEICIHSLAEHFRNLLLCRDKRTVHLLEAGASFAQRYVQQAELCSESFLLSALNLINECEINLRMARNRRLHVELYLLKITYIGRALDWSKRTDSTVEKKKHDPITPAQPLIVSNKPAPSIRETITEPSQGTVKEPEKANYSETKQPATPTRTSLQKPDSTVRLSLDSYDAEVKLEATISASKVSLFKKEAVLASWNKYLERAESAILRSNMRIAKLEVDEEGKRLKVLTHNGVARDMVLQEKGLLDTMRSDLNEPLMMLSVEVDASAVEAPKSQAPPRALTAREKFEAMARANAHLINLTNEFDLKLQE